ncbi:MAG: DNA polymerase III subunit delta', partial [Proteobacteria bacterium]|nr:DNA polymerase III subunit delta' [Pseudomonadota bacterium]
MDIQPQGNRSVLKILERLSANKKIPHAYIFSGREGIGKKLYALFFAKMLNCLAEKGQKPCNVCSNCIKLGKNIHPDIKIISTDKKQIKVEEIKSAISFTNSSPIEGRYKFIIIDDAHKMNQFSSNSLLKTLEEPLSDSIFILITDNDKNLLPTILSRCVKISFGPLTEKELEEILIQKGYRKEQIFQIVPYANGSVKIAEDLL